MPDVRVVTSIDELKQYVGRELGVGPWHDVTQQMIDAFADLSGDDQWIHVDVERAKQSPFGSTIAHGLLTVTLLPLLQKNREGVRIELPRKMALNYGVNRIRFLTPVRAGSRVRLRTKLLAVDERDPGIYHLVQEQTVELEGSQKPAMVAETIARVYL